MKKIKLLISLLVLLGMTPWLIPSGFCAAITNRSVGGVINVLGGTDPPTFDASSLTNIPPVTHTGEVTGTTALTVTDNVIDEANLKLNTGPVKGCFARDS